MAKWSFINNEFLPEQRAMISARDLSLLRGYAVFDFFRFENKQPLFLSDHLERLFHSSKTLNLTIERSAPEIAAIAKELINRNDIEKGGIRITITGGLSNDGFNPGSPQLIISQHDFSEPGELNFQKGIRLISHLYQRQIPEVKSIDYLMAIYLRRTILDAGADDVIYHDGQNISESPRSNIFIVTEDQAIATPANNILKGVTRKKILELASDYYKVEERNISISELMKASEVFISSTTKKILPVHTIDGVDLGTGERPVASHLLQLYNKLCSDNCG